MEVNNLVTPFLKTSNFNLKTFICLKCKEKFESTQHDLFCKKCIDESTPTTE